MGSINWDKYRSELEQIVEATRSRTNTRLATEASRVSRLTDDEIKRLFPEPRDVQRLVALMEVVKRSGNRNEKVNHLVRNAEEFGSIILTLLSRLA